jgi:hypothetical protein
MEAYRQWVLAGPVLFGIYLSRKLALWMMRKRAFSRTMPTVAVLLPPDSLLRKVWPRKWQTFHYDWYLHNKKTVYQQLGSDVFALVSLFGDDTVTTRDPAAFVEVKITDSERFPKDLKQVSVVCASFLRIKSSLPYTETTFLRQRGSNGNIIAKLQQRHSPQETLNLFKQRQSDKPPK